MQPDLLGTFGRKSFPLWCGNALEMCLISIKVRAALRAYDAAV